MAFNLDDRIASALKLAQKTLGEPAEDFGWEFLSETLPAFHVIQYWGEIRDDIDDITREVFEALHLHRVHAMWSGFGYDPIYVPEDDELCEGRQQTQTSAATVRQFTRLLTEAFELLAEENDIMSAQDFMCCQNRAIAALELMAEGQDARGYVFYDRKDADGLDELGWLCLSYGSCQDDSAGAHLAIGHTVADALRKVGLRVVWNGQLDHRIRVHLPKIIEQLS